jgi:hypothetical protein
MKKINIKLITALLTVVLVAGVSIFYACKKEEDKTSQSKVTEAYQEEFVSESLYIPDFHFSSAEELYNIVDEYSQLYKFNIRSMSKTIAAANIPWKQMANPLSKNSLFDLPDPILQQLEILLQQLQSVPPLSSQAEAILNQIWTLLDIDPNNLPDYPAELEDLGGAICAMPGFDNLTEEQRLDCIALARWLMVWENEDPLFEPPHDCPCWDSYLSTWTDLTIDFGIDAALCLLAGPAALACGGIQGIRYLWKVEKARRKYVTCQQINHTC